MKMNGRQEVDSGVFSPCKGASCNGRQEVDSGVYSVHVKVLHVATLKSGGGGGGGGGACGVGTDEVDEALMLFVCLLGLCRAGIARELTFPSYICKRFQNICIISHFICSALRLCCRYISSVTICTWVRASCH